MADDLDQELLGMVDDGASDDESVDDFDRLEAEVGDGDVSDAEPKQSVEKAEEPPERRKGIAQKVRGRRKRQRKQESEEPDDVLSSDPDESDGPNDLDILDAEADALGDDDSDEPAPLYPVEGRYLSEADRQYVNNLPEIRREEILADRAQEVMKRQQDLQLKKALASSAASKKRKAAASELDENTNRRSTRPKTEKQNALDSYRRAREEKGAQRDRLATGAQDRKDERSPSSPPRSGRDADGESDVEYADLSERKDEPPVELKDVNHCKVGRTAFASYCFYPGFEDTVKGCFARVSIGLNRETGQNQYRMAQIKGFTEGKPYQMENAARKPFTTDQYAIVAQGSAEKPWPFHACSDGNITETEWQRYKDTLAKENLRLPSAKQLLRKNNEINRMIDTKFTDDMLNQKFAKQRAIELKYDDVHQARLKRKEINRRRAEAEENGDEEEVARLDAELEAMDNQAANGTSTSAVKIKAQSTASPVKPVAISENLAMLNRQNRSKNQQEVRMALIAERKKILKAREEAKTAKAAEHKAQAASEAQRRASQNQELFGEEATPDVSRAGTPAVIGGELKMQKKKKVELPILGAGGKGPVGALKKKNLDDDVIGGLDLDIDLEI